MKKLKAISNKRYAVSDKPHTISRQRAFALLVVIIVLLILMLLGSMIIAGALSEFKISKSQESGTGAFYLAQSGIDHALWKVQNDPAYKTNLENGTFDSSNGNFTYNPALLANGSYSVQIRSTSEGEAQVTSTGYFQIGDHRAKRVVKTKIFKALNPNPVGENAIFAAQNVDFMMSICTISPGSLFANGDIHVGVIPILGSVITVEKDVAAVGEIKVVLPSSINAQHLYASNYPPAPEGAKLPMVDFTDYFNKATVVYTKDQLETLMKANQNLILNGIVYVTMSPNDYLNIRGNQSLTVNGLLVLDGGIKIGKNLCWHRGPGNNTCGNDDITVAHTVGQPSGIIAKGIIDFGLFAGNINIAGILYGYGGFEMFSLPQNFNITGGIITRDFFASSIWHGITIHFDNEIIQTGLGEPKFSPAIQIEHWEEEY